MFIHLGGDKLVSVKNIIMIINLENKNKNNINQNFLKNVREETVVKKLDGNDFKAMVVTDDLVYLSPISSMTLKKRADFINNLA